MTSVIKLLRSDPAATEAAEAWNKHYFRCPLCQSAYTKINPVDPDCAEGLALKRQNDKVGRWMMRAAR